MPLDTRIGRGLAEAWDNIVEGWQSLRERAGRALTRFTPGRSEEVQTSQERITRLSSRWGLLPAEIVETDDALIVRLEAPGMETEDFDVQVLGDALVIRGEKHARREESRGRYHVLECAYGRFERAIPLPLEVDDRRARARYRRGVLSVTLPKRRAAGRRIEIGR